MKNMPCPCCSGKTYTNCCQKYHLGEIPEIPLSLMRSRYSAYALGKAEYIIETTHPQSPYFLKDKTPWLKQIHHFSQQVSFDRLEILDTQIFDSEAYVTFIAYLSKNGEDLTFTEQSRFLRQGNSWKYMDGKISRGRLTKEQIKAI